MNLAGFVLANALRNRRRSVLTFLSLGFSVLLMTTLEGLLDHVETFPTKTGGESRLVCRNRLSFFNRIPLAYLDRIRQARGVMAATPYCFFGGSYRGQLPQFSFPQFAVDPAALRTVIPELRTVDPATGRPEPRLYADFEADATGALAGLELCRRFGWKLGERIPLAGVFYPFDVTLTLRGAITAEAAAETGLVYFHFDTFNEAGNRLDAMTAVILRAASPEEMPAVVARIDGMFENSAHPTTTEAEQALRARAIGFLGNVTFFVRAIGTAIAFTMLMVAANTSSMMARERASEIAVLKALGFTPLRVMACLWTESTLVAAAGAALGVAGACAAVPALRLAALDTQLARLLASYQLAPAVAASTFLLGTTVGFLSCLLPSWNVARKPIATTIRRAG